MGTYVWLHGTALEETLETTTKPSKVGKDEQCWRWSALPHTHALLTVTISERSPHSPPVMEQCVVHPFAQLPAPALSQLCSTCDAKSVLLVTDLIHLGIRLANTPIVPAFVDSGVCFLAQVWEAWIMQIGEVAESSTPSSADSRKRERHLEDHPSSPNPFLQQGYSYSNKATTPIPSQVAPLSND